jgi:DNA-packaging protein gp3
MPHPKATKAKISDEQYAKIRARWQGSPAEGFSWLAREVKGAYDINITRQALAQTAAHQGWKKDKTKSEPLAIVAQFGEVLTAPGMTPDDLVRKRMSDAFRAEANNIVGSNSNSKSNESQASNSKPDSKSKGKKSGKQSKEQATELAPPTTPPTTRLPTTPEPDVVTVMPDGQALVTPGRPVSYRPEYAQQIITFFSGEPFEHVEVQSISGTTKMQMVAKDPPTLAGFASRLGITLETLNSWATAVKLDGAPRFPEFFDAYARARQLQESLLVRGAALGVYSDRFIPFVLKNWHGWQDQPERAMQADPVSIDELESLFTRHEAEAEASMLRTIAEREALDLDGDMSQLSADLVRAEREVSESLRTDDGGEVAHDSE